MFEEIFAQIENRLKGFKAISVVSSDGIEIASKIKEELPHEILSAELNNILHNLERLKSDISIGSYEEVIIKTDQENVILIKMSDDAFVLLVTDKTDPTGRSVYEVQRLAFNFLEML